MVSRPTLFAKGVYMLYNLKPVDALDDFDEMFDDDEWEDTDFEASISKQYPGWYLVKLPGFTPQMFLEVKAWLADGNVQYGQCTPVGWSSGCAYSVGVVFESGRDAMLFKLRWR
jgi:hypothetical protein